MKFILEEKKMRRFFIVLCCILMSSTAALATNGDILIGIGPISRAMGGAGTAAPQDAISAVFANPAAMCFGPYCPSSELNFAGTLFSPDVKAKVTTTSGVIQADSDDNIYAIPAFGLSVPIGDGSTWRFGLSAYGVSGLGVDYRDSNLDQSYAPFGGYPLIAGTYTQFQLMKFSPAISYQVNDQFSVGLGVHIDYSSLDLRNGTSYNYGLGAQIGAIWKPFDRLSLGVTYTSPQKINYEKVADFDGDGTSDDLELESPHEVGFGVAYTFLGDRLLLESDVKWYGWSSATGYEDFDWEDQWIFLIGGQFKPIDKLALRLGYNYGKNPLNEHSNFNGTGTTSVQGKTMPNYYYETFRFIGFPAIVEHHFTGGIGYEFTQKFSANLGFMIALQNDISETGTDITGQPVTIESELSEYSIDFGLTWRF